MHWSASALKASSSIEAASPVINAASRSDWEATPLFRLQVNTVFLLQCWVPIPIHNVPVVGTWI